MHNKSNSFFHLFSHPITLSLLDSVLKEGSYNSSEPYYLYNISARNPLLGNPGQQLHTDSNLPGVNYCIIANAIWALDDFTAKNGATRVVPGSHTWKHYPEDGQIHPDEILLTAPKGSLILFNGSLHHGGGPNLSGDSRWAVVLGYARWFIKPSFDYLSNTPVDIYNGMSDLDKSLLGFIAILPKMEFTRVRRRSIEPSCPNPYRLPNT